MNDIEILCLGSGSSGNCYLLKKGDECIMVECGLTYKTIVSKLADYDLQIEQIKACVVSHSHKDHALAYEDIKSLGIPVFAPFVADSSEEIDKPFKLTEWAKVRAFRVEHDVPCYGFAFLTSDKESILFVTDTRYMESQYFKYKYNYILIECNHIRKQLEAIMDKALLEGNESKVFKFKRQASYHLSLAGVKKILNSMDLSQTKAILLMHLSKECCNDDLIKKEIAAKYKKPTFVCYRQGGIN
jgi:phosphoribosyl 1,2-cyclic phosphodiesterase